MKELTVILIGSTIGSAIGWLANEHDLFYEIRKYNPIFINKLLFIIHTPIKVFIKCRKCGKKWTIGAKEWFGVNKENTDLIKQIRAHLKEEESGRK